MSRPEPPDPRAHPSAKIDGAVAHYGARTIALWCADLLAERVDRTDLERPSLAWVGFDWDYGRSRMDASDDRYWPRVWGARGLLHVWTPEAAPAVIDGLRDQAWRVREMCAKVVRLRELGEAAELLVDLTADEVPRVRAAGARALGAVGEGEHAVPLRIATGDVESVVRTAAEAALDELRLRLDRDL